MNPAGQSETQSSGKRGKLAWLPILLLLAAIIAARAAGVRDTFESQTLQLLLSFIFYTLVSLGTLYLIGRSFLASGSPGLLLLECGVVLWSLAGTVGDFVSHGGPNINVTIFNIGILLAGLCHLAGAILALNPQRVFRRKALWLAAGCASALGALWLISKAALLGWLPVFFIPGHGGTLVRYSVLISAIAMFVLSSGLLHANQRAARLPFTSWYKLALLLLAVGLFGIMIQLSLGSIVNWLSRTAQWLGGLYLLFAALASLRESHLPLFPMEKKSHPAYYRDTVAMAVVFAAAAIRLVFLTAMGTQAPYLVFFPAVVFAAIYGGLRGGLVATVASAILVDYFWIEPVNQFKIGQLSDQLSTGVFLLSGGMIAWVADSMHRAWARAFEAEAQALLAVEREKTAEALYESRARLEAALASMRDAVFISDAQGRFMVVNDAVARYYRFTNKDECFKTLAEYPDVLDIFLPGGTPAPLDMWALPRALRGEAGTNAEYILRRKDTGETWTGSYSFAPIRDKDGVIVGSVVVARDITEQKRVEEQLRQAEEKSRLLIKHAPSMFYEIDFHRPAFKSVNDVMCQFLGYTREELLALNPFDLLDDEGKAVFRERIRKVLAGEPVSESVEYKSKTKDGREVYGVLNMTFTYKDGKPEGAVVVAHDITERKKAEEALHRSNTLLNAIMESTPDPVYVKDDQSRILMANPALAKVVGKPLEKILGRTDSEYYGDLDTGQALREHDLRVMKSGQNEVTEETVPTPDGFRTFLSSKTPYRNTSGDIIGITGISRDITERKRAEEALKRAHIELERRVQERTSELSEVVQRLRAEIVQRRRLEDSLRESENQVRFFASQCLTAQETERKRVAGELHDSIAAALGAMKFRIDKIVEEMKQGHDGPESLKDLASRVTEINNEVRRIMADLRPSILDDLGILAAINWLCREHKKTYSHISVEEQIGITEDEVPDSLKTPIFRIAQEAMNNISKYSKASLVNLSLQKEDGTIRLAIQDNGQGFDLATVRKGLGLSTMRERAQLSGGTFDLESAVGKGTVIRVTWSI